MHSNSADVNSHPLHPVTCELPAIRHHKIRWKYMMQVQWSTGPNIKLGFWGVCVLVFGFYRGFFGGFWGFVFYILRKLWKIPLKKSFTHLGGIRFISIISLVSLKSALLQEKQHYFHF